MSIFFWSFGAICILLFHERIYLPIVVSAIVIALAAWHLIRLYRQSRVGPLTMLLFVTYALPFMHIVPYIWFDFEAESPLIMWGMMANPYMTDKTIIELMSMIGAVGAAGFMVGASLLQGKLSMASTSEAMGRYPAFGKTLSLPVFYTWIAISVVLTWITAPADTIFTAVYTESKSISDNWNFSSSAMFSYAFLLFALADSMFEASPKIGKLKRKIVVFAFLLIVIWFQLLRGNRDSLPCVIGGLLMYYVWGKGLLGSVKERVKIKRHVLFLALFVIAVVSYIFGSLRYTAVGVGSISDMQNVFIDLAETGAIRFDNLITGTWSGALLTPLSVAGDYINDTLPLKYGQTYLDLLCSIVPGFLADWIGYTRPIDAFQGPAWEMAYGQGGTHAVVVPFIDFRMAGVFMIVALWSLALAKIERYSISRLTVSNLSLLGIMTATIPHWLWYGEKNIMNGLIIWLMVSILYRALLAISAVNSTQKRRIR